MKLESRKVCFDCAYFKDCTTVSMAADDDGYVDINELKSLAYDCSHYYNPKE